MKLNTVIFDMDGLLIDSEPLWNEAADEIFKRHNIKLTPLQHASSTGMRTKEFTEWWFTHFNIPLNLVDETCEAILQAVLEKISKRGKAMPGVEHIFNFFINRNFKMGLASSSPMELIDVVVNKLGIRNHLQAICSAALLPLGKPHPQVYLDCAAILESHPTACICFEDSFNGLVAAKAARMKCVVVPSHHDSKQPRFGAADLKYRRCKILTNC